MKNPIVQQEQASLTDFFACMQRERWTRQQLMDHQARAIQACRQYAYEHSPFYQRFHRGLMDRPLSELPVVTKAMLMEHFDEVVTDRAIHLSDLQQHLESANSSQLYLDRYLVTLTSGSCGHPGLFLYDPTEATIDTNSFTRTFSWAGATPESRVAAIGSTDPDQGSAQIPITADEQALPRLQLSATDSLPRLVQRLNDWQPEMLLCYSSLAGLLVDEQRAGRLHIAPRVIGCAAEPLTGETRRRIEETWQIQPFNVYGTTEGGVLAAECEQHQGLHLFEDFSLIEVVDEQNRPVPPGEQGARVLLTVPFRRTQPLIRYELTDRVCLSTRQRCACGRPFALIEDIEGRTTEQLFFPSASGTGGILSTIVFEFIFDHLPINCWQVIQEHDGLHILVTGASEGLRDELISNGVQEMFTKQELLVPPIIVHRVEALTRNASGKALRLISRISPQT